jgi:hypothetical protein
MATAGSNCLAVFSTPKQRTRCRHNNLLGLEATRALQAGDEGRDRGIEAHHGQRRPQRGIADLGDARRSVDRGAGPVVAWVEPRIGENLATATQNPWLRITANSEAASVLPTPLTLSSRSRLPRKSASWSIVSPMALSIASSWLFDRRGGRPGAVLSPIPLPMRFFHYARLLTMPGPRLYLAVPASQKFRGLIHQGGDELETGQAEAAPLCLAYALFVLTGLAGARGDRPKHGGANFGAWKTGGGNGMAGDDRAERR